MKERLRWEHCFLTLGGTIYFFRTQKTTKVKED